MLRIWSPELGSRFIILMAQCCDLVFVLLVMWSPERGPYVNQLAPRIALLRLKRFNDRLHYEEEIIFCIDACLSN
jgi:hypothetical protein